jgi:hypothetical protein
MLKERRKEPSGSMPKAKEGPPGPKTKEEHAGRGKPKDAPPERTLASGIFSRKEHDPQRRKGTSRKKNRRNPLPERNKNESCEETTRGNETALANIGES